MRELARQFLALAEKQGTTAPLMIGHRLMGSSLVFAGNIAQGRSHLDQAIALYDSATHRPLATRFVTESGVSILGFRGRALWLLGYPEAALTNAEHSVENAREIGQAVTLMLALFHASVTRMLRGDYTAANTETDELLALADAKTAPQWKALGMLNKGCLLALTGKTSDAVQAIDSGLAAQRATGATTWRPQYLSFLGIAYAELDQFTDARRCLGEAMNIMETSNERLEEAEVNRIAGEIALKSPERDTAKAEAYFKHALSVARAQQAKSWELRAAMSMARLWRDQGKRHEARDLLAPVYGWFTEGFDTLDLKEAKALLDELRA
jgi:predicted ATPase